MISEYEKKIYNIVKRSKYPMRNIDVSNKCNLNRATVGKYLHILASKNKIKLNKQKSYNLWSVIK